MDLSDSCRPRSLIIRNLISLASTVTMRLFLSFCIDRRSCCLGRTCEYITYSDDLTSKVDLGAFGQFIALYESGVVSDFKWVVLGVERERKLVGMR